MFTIKTFRYVALAEATSFLILLVAAVLKRTADSNAGGVGPIMGPIHGVLFVAYVVIALSVREPGRLDRTPDAAACSSAPSLPFGGFVVDRWLARTGQLKTA